MGDLPPGSVAVHNAGLWITAGKGTYRSGYPQALENPLQGTGKGVSHIAHSHGDDGGLRDSLSQGGRPPCTPPRDVAEVMGWCLERLGYAILA